MLTSDSVGGEGGESSETDSQGFQPMIDIDLTGLLKCWKTSVVADATKNSYRAL